MKKNAEKPNHKPETFFKEFCVESLKNTYGYLMFHSLVYNGVGTLNANKDGTPKSVIIGGEERNRISSQKNRYEMRKALRGMGYDLSTQTRELPLILNDLAVRPGKPGEEEKEKKDAELFVTALLSKFLKHKDKDKDDKKKKKPEDGKEKEKKEEKMEVCRFTKKEIDLLKDLSIRRGQGEEIKLDKLNLNHNVNRVDEVDLFLFGRMRPKKITGSLRVSSGVGICRKVSEKEFFIASDDLLERNSDTGDVSHLNDRYLSAFLSYHYSVLNLNQVMAYYGNDLERVNKLIMDCFTLVSEHAPKSNSVGSPNQGVTVHVMAEKSKSPLSLEVAFETPLDTTEECIESLRSFKKSMGAMYNRNNPSIELCGLPNVQGCATYDDVVKFIKL